MGPRCALLACGGGRGSSLVDGLAALGRNSLLFRGETSMRGTDDVLPVDAGRYSVTRAELGLSVGIQIPGTCGGFALLLALERDLVTFCGDLEPPQEFRMGNDGAGAPVDELLDESVNQLGAFFDSSLHRRDGVLDSLREGSSINLHLGGIILSVVGAIFGQDESQDLIAQELLDDLLDLVVVMSGTAAFTLLLGLGLIRIRNRLLGSSTVHLLLPTGDVGPPTGLAGVAGISGLWSNTTHSDLFFVTDRIRICPDCLFPLAKSRAKMDRNDNNSTF